MIIEIGGYTKVVKRISCKVVESVPLGEASRVSRRQEPVSRGSRTTFEASDALVHPCVESQISGPFAPGQICDYYA